MFHAFTFQLLVDNDCDDDDDDVEDDDDVTRKTRKSAI